MKTVRRGLIGIGALTMAYAVSGALTDADLRAGALVFLIAVLAVHDGVLLPLTIAVGILTGRVVRTGGRAVVRAGLIASLGVTVVALPLVLGRGRAADNPSVLPLHYGRGLLVVYALIWLAVAARAGWVARSVSNRKGSGGGAGG
jgi:hypothetical protein